MASTLGTRVQSYVGTFADTTSLTDWLTAGARKLVDLIPEDKAHLYTAAITIASGGTDLSAYRVVSASHNNYGCRRVGPEMMAKVQDVDSIHLASPQDPVYLLKDTKGYIFPDSGTNSCQAILYPTVLYTDTAITNFPGYYEQGVVLYAATQALEQMANQAIDVDEDIEKGNEILAQLKVVEGQYTHFLATNFPQFRQAQQ